MNVRGINDVRQRETHTAESLVSECNCSEVEIDNENLKRYKLTGIDQILGEIIQSGGNILRSSNHEHINPI